MPVAPNASKTLAQIILKGTLAAGGGSTKDIALTFWYRRTAVVLTPTKLSLSNAFLAGPYAAMLAAFNIGWTLGTTNIRWFDDVFDPTTTTSLAGVGAIGTDRAASFNSIYMLFRSNVRGRKFIRGVHFPAVNEIDTTSDVLTGAGLVRWQAVQTSLIASLTDSIGNIWNPCVVTYKGSVWKSNPTSVTYNDVTQIVLDLNLGTMLKRKVATVR